MKAVVMGSGGWGTALSQVLCDNGHDTWLWSHNAAKAAEMQKTRENPLLKGVILPETLQITSDLSCLEGADLALRVDAAQAQEAALAAAGGGEVVGQEIDQEGPWNEYSFDIVNGDVWYEVEVNAFGRVTGLESGQVGYGDYSHWE